MSDHYPFCVVDFPKCKNVLCVKHVCIRRSCKQEYCSNSCRQIGRKLFPVSEKVRQAGRDAAKRNGSGYKPGSGRGKSGWYGGFWCDSSYELAYVIYNIEHNIEFFQNTDRFSYIINNKSHTYIPDFVLPDGTYVEIKGYETERDHAKWSQFPERLSILRKDDLTIALEYVKVKYGRDFVSLYGRAK